MKLIVPPNTVIIKVEALPNASGDIALNIIQNAAGRVQDPKQVGTVLQYSIPKTKYSQNVFMRKNGNLTKFGGGAMDMVVRYIPISNRFTVSLEKA